jgi:hypothetical protein
LQDDLQKMKTQSLIRIAILMAVLLPFMWSCDKNTPAPPDPPVNTSFIGFRFVHLVDSVPLELDTFNYITKGGVLYKITDLQYFISRITLYMHGGGDVVLSDGDSIRYIDHRFPETQTWIPAGDIPAVEYDSIAFTFGLNEQQNISNRFPNPPERDMFWPEVLGGGYHHMKLNSVWKSCCTNLESPFMMHVGTGQIYSSPTPNTDSIIGFVQNAFRVVLPGSSFTAKKDSTFILGIVMNIDHWFNGPPNMLDLNIMPQGIMQDQENMAKICDNGKGAFSVKSEK